MLSVSRKNSESKQPNTAQSDYLANNLDISDTKPSPHHALMIDHQNNSSVVTIAQLRSAYIERNLNRRKRYQEQKALEIKARWEHAEVIKDTLNRIAVCYCLENTLTSQDIYAFYDSYRWSCAFTGTWHSADTPINVHFITPLDMNGRIEIRNMKPRYYDGWLSGEYRLRRSTIEYLPPQLAPLEVFEQGA